HLRPDAGNLVGGGYSLGTVVAVRLVAGVAGDVARLGAHRCGPERTRLFPVLAGERDHGWGAVVVVLGGLECGVRYLPRRAELAGSVQRLEQPRLTPVGA